jgi:hypothetical protein
MTKERARDLYRKLSDLARRPGSTAEGESAATLAAELKSKFDLEDDGTDDEAFSLHWRPRRPDPEWEDFVHPVRTGESPFRAWAAGPGATVGVFLRPNPAKGAVSTEAPSHAFRDEFDDDFDDN